MRLACAATPGSRAAPETLACDQRFCEAYVAMAIATATSVMTARAAKARGFMVFLLAPPAPAANAAQYAAAASLPSRYRRPRPGAARAQCWQISTSHRGGRYPRAERA